MNEVTTATAHLTEVFSSVQGEGPYVGVRQVFLRFYGCHRRCAYCDSPETVTAWQPAGFRPEGFRVEVPPGSGTFEAHGNPAGVEDVLALLARLDQPRGLHHSVALTGGEPLLHAPFLRELMPRIRELGMKTYLETAGDLFHEFETVLAVTDIVAMDIKLPSVTKNGPAWGHHRQFLQRCVDAGVEVFVKAIVSGDTKDEDIRVSAEIIAGAAPGTLFVLQPLTPFGTETAVPTAGQLLQWQKLAGGTLAEVRVIPQCHKMTGNL